MRPATLLHSLALLALHLIASSHQSLLDVNFDKQGSRGFKVSVSNGARASYNLASKEATRNGNHGMRVTVDKAGRGNQGFWMGKGVCLCGVLVVL